ncbi:hypothetical protein KSS87_017607 [Heliosperma pusillum]|nr:hypothetical protein KSS87_017607 [Heliosperma pusillum]
MSSEENQRRDLKRRREPSIGSSTSSTDSNSNTTIKPLEMAWTCEDTNFLKNVILDFSCGKDHWEHRAKYWDKEFWNAIAGEYNKRANTANVKGEGKKIQGHSADQVIDKAFELLTEYSLTQRMLNMYKRTKSGHEKRTCEACERLKAYISNQHSRITQRFSRSLSDGSHKRQKTNSVGINSGQAVSHERISFATIGNNLGQAVEMGESSHAMNDACGDVAVAISRLLFNLWEEKLVSDDEYSLLLRTRTLAEGLWPSTLLCMNHTKERIVSMLKKCLNCSGKGRVGADDPS